MSELSFDEMARQMRELQERRNRDTAELPVTPAVVPPESATEETTVLPRFNPTDPAYSDLWRPEGAAPQPRQVQPVPQYETYSDHEDGRGARILKRTLGAIAAISFVVGGAGLAYEVGKDNSPHGIAASQEPTNPDVPVAISSSASASPSPSKSKKSSPSPSASASVSASASASASPSASSSHRVVLPSAPAKPTHSPSPSNGEDCHWNMSGNNMLTIGECGSDEAHWAYNSPGDTTHHTIAAAMVKAVCHPNGYNDNFIQIKYGSENQYIDYIKDVDPQTGTTLFDDSRLPLSC